MVVLFSGHMIDAADRAVPRFPPAEEPTAARAIAAVLDEFGAGPGAVGLCGGACGGDLLFAEALLARGGSVDLHLPLLEAEFVRTSVAFAKAPSPLRDRWRERFEAVKARPTTRLLELPAVLGPTPPGMDPYERCNAWMLDAAFVPGRGPVRFVCLWDGGGGDGPGGTRHMVEEVRRRGGETFVLDTTRLWSVARPA